MKTSPALLFLLVAHLASLRTAGNGQKHLVVTQQETVTAEAGGSVTISCVFMATSTAYSVTWTLGCSPDALSLQNLTCFKQRVKLSPPDLVQIPHSLDVHSYKITTAVTIINLTENDCGSFCCHIMMADEETGTGNGTRLEVTPRSCPAASSKLVPLLVEVLRLICLFILVILLGIAVKTSC